MRRCGWSLWLSDSDLTRRETLRGESQVIQQWRYTEEWLLGERERGRGLRIWRWDLITDELRTILERVELGDSWEKVSEPSWEAHGSRRVSSRGRAL